MVFFRRISKISLGHNRPTRLGRHMEQQWHHYTIVFANGKKMLIDIVKDQAERRSAQSAARQWAILHGTVVVSVKRTK